LHVGINQFALGALLPDVAYSPQRFKSMFFDAEMNCDLNSTLDLGKIAERSSNKFDLIIRSSYAKRQREIETKRFGSR
jgi:hypothetical protein